MILFGKPLGKPLVASRAVFKRKVRARCARTVARVSPCQSVSVRAASVVSQRLSERKHVERHARLQATVHVPQRRAEADVHRTEREARAAGHAPAVRDVGRAAAKVKQRNAAELETTRDLRLRSDRDAVADPLAHVGREGRRAVQRIRDARATTGLNLSSATIARRLAGAVAYG